MSEQVKTVAPYERGRPATTSLFSVRFALFAAALTAAILVATWLVAGFRARATARELSAYHLAALASALKPQILQDMTHPGTKDSLNVTLAALEREHGLRARVRNPDGAVRFSWSRAEIPDSTGPERDRPPPAVLDNPSGAQVEDEPVLEVGKAAILRQTLRARGDCAECHAPVGGRVGSLEMEVPVERFGVRASRAIYEVALVAAAFLVLFLGFAVLAVRRVSSRLHALTADVAQAAAGDPARRLRTVPKDEMGALAASINALIDALDESRRREAEVRRHRASHDRQLALTGELAAAAAHEVKNPLGAVTVALDAMIRKEQDPERRELLFRIRSRLDEIQAVVTGLLEFSRPRNPVLLPMSPAVLVDKVLAMLDEKVRKHGVVVRHRPDADLPAVAVDERLMGQVLINLLFNAIEARPEGLELTIEIHRAPGPEQGGSGPGAVRILVRDNGQGISPAELPNLFQPFHSTKTRGSGLGLVISRDIVERHGGTLTVESQPGRGACFTIELPAAEDPAGTPMERVRA